MMANTTLPTPTRSIITCFDSFKTTLDARSLGETVIQTFEKRNDLKNIRFRNVPLADGGEGFLQSMCNAMMNDDNTIVRQLYCEVDHFLRCNEYKANKTKPRTISVPFALATNKDTNETKAIVEMALICGLELYGKQEAQDPFRTTTRGLGQVLRHIHEQHGCRHVLLGIGGSATSDGGLGALHALGLGIVCEQNGEEYCPEVFYGKDLTFLKSIDSSTLQPVTREMRIEIACDVTNPFIGNYGAVRVFAPQKGATQEQIEALERGMIRLNELIIQQTCIDLSTVAGAGAAGGVGGSFHALLCAELKRGSKLVADAVTLEEAIAKSDLVITGEGSYDEQTSSGKTVSMVKHLCDLYGKPLVIICGVNKVSHHENTLSTEATVVYDLLSLFPLERAMSDTAHCIEQLVEHHMDDMLHNIIR